MPLIELKGIKKTYRIGDEQTVYALKDINLSIEHGEFVSIMGVSGSGKSTLLGILGLLDKSDAGQYLLLGKDISKLSDNEYARLRNRFFGFIFQMFNLLPRLNVLDNAMIPFIYRRGVSQEERKNLKDIIKKVGLSDRINHRPNQLSGGQQQRVAIARALSNNPMVILADEPTGNLDSKSTVEIINILKELNNAGNTIIMVTHNPELAEVSSRVIKLRDGDIISDEVKRKGPASKSIELSSLKEPGRKIFSFSEIINYIYESFMTIRANKLRSFLSILGVMIGVAAVIAMLAVGTGAKKEVEKSLASLGTNLLMVRTSNVSRGISMGTDSTTRFTFADLEALKKIDAVKSVVPYASGRAQVVFQNKNWNTSVVGTGTDYQAVRDAVPQNGKFFSPGEYAGRAKVAVIGVTVANELFGSENPVGKQIRINRISFKVVGVLPEKGVSGFRNQDDQIIVPVTTAMYRLFGTDYINYFDVQVKDADSMDYVLEEIPAVIVKLHRLTEDQTDRIEIRNMADIQKAASEMVNTLSYLLGAIAAVSLLVGGIGIMNIMLVMVMERTREIGLRKSLGAENSDIMLQFLIEGVMICVFGGIIGILFGSGVSWTISALAGWTTYISMGSIMLALIFSVLTGLIFSLWPAWRAAKLLPIVALRYE
ncbi:MAG: ABC transporter permease [Candidatus Saganbacteria bacterium]|nr:ABC transporter permease [Candidatus Saganbacteria bacterium]